MTEQATMIPGETDVFFCFQCQCSRSKIGSVPVRDKAGVIVRRKCAVCVERTVKAANKEG